MSELFPRDRHIRRSGSDYAASYLSMLPQGQAWPREPGSTLERIVSGLCEYWGFVDSRAGDLLERESDPRKTIEILSDWERAWGLPDECFPDATTIGERQKMLVLVMTLLGAQSREFFLWVAEWVGYGVTNIREWSPFMCGISQVGDTRDEWGDYRWEIGPPEMRFYWATHAATAVLTWFRAASGQAGVDPHLKIGIATNLECLFQRWCPAHTKVIFDYTALAYGGPMQGTP